MSEELAQDSPVCTPPSFAVSTQSNRQPAPDLHQDALALEINPWPCHHQLRQPDQPATTDKSALLTSLRKRKAVDSDTIVHDKENARVCAPGDQYQPHQSPPAHSGGAVIAVEKQLNAVFSESAPPAASQVPEASKKPQSNVDPEILVSSGSLPMTTLPDVGMVKQENSSLATGSRLVRLASSDFICVRV